MSCFVIGNNFLFFWRNDFCFSFQSTDHTINRILEVLNINCLLISSCCNECRLVTYVRYFSSCKTGGLSSKLFNIYGWIGLDWLQVNFEDRLAANDVWFIDTDLSVEST